MDRIWQVGLVSGHTWLNKMLLLKEEGAKGVNSDTEVQSAQHQLYPFVRWDSKHFLMIHYQSGTFGGSNILEPGSNILEPQNFIFNILEGNEEKKLW